MPRRARVVKRIINPDSLYHSKVVAKFINRIMLSGKKSTAERIVYGAMGIIEAQTKKAAIDTFDLAMRNITPVLEVKPRRVGGATYQVPVEIKGERRIALAMRWLIDTARGRSGKSMAEKLAAEILDASHGVGPTIKKREDTHKMAEANKAFAHYRW
ncbi:MAG: 30S ribosomal protein S7 [Dehalococcoidia bacterium]|nr:30S ribosomal protein S7 [Dehalococcoidia bacterium]